METKDTNFDNFLKEAIHVCKCDMPESCPNAMYSQVENKLVKSIQRDKSENRKILRISLIAIIFILLINVSFAFVNKNVFTYIPIFQNENDTIFKDNEISSLFYIDEFITNFNNEFNLDN